MEKTEKEKNLIIALVATALFMEFMDVSIINTAIPYIAQSLHTDPLSLKFAITSYLVSLAIFIPVSAWVADRIGLRTTFSAAIAIFVVASALCGASDSLVELSVFRALQGLGGAMMTPVGRLILVRTFPPKEFVRATMLVFLPALLGPVAGPLLGGVLTTSLSWRWIFYINVPIGIILFFGVLKFIQNEKSAVKKKLDILGFLLCATALACLSLVFETVGESLIPSGFFKTLLVIGCASLVLFLYHSLRQKEKALFNFTVFKLRTFRVAAISNALTLTGVGSISFLLSLLFQLQLGMTPVKAGFFVSISAIGSLIVRGIASRFLRKFGFRRVMMFAPFGVSLSLVLLGFISVESSQLYIVSVIFMSGFFNVLSFSSSGPLMYVDLPREQSANGTGIDTTLRQFVMSLSIALSAILLSLFMRSSHISQSHGEIGVLSFRHTFFVLAVFPLIQVFFAFTLKEKDGEEAAKGAR